MGQREDRLVQSRGEDDAVKSESHNVLHGTHLRQQFVNPKYVSANDQNDSMLRCLDVSAVFKSSIVFTRSRFSEK